MKLMHKDCISCDKLFLEKIIKFLLYVKQVYERS
jgi:hypothetical protein